LKNLSDRDIENDINVRWFSFRLSALSKLTQFSTPICITNIIGILTNFFAIMMVGYLGELELAASALATASYTTLMLVSSTSLYAVSILIGHEKYKPDKVCTKIGAIFKSGCWLSILFSVPTGIVLWHADYILLLIGQHAELVDLTVSYFKFSAIAIFPLLLSIVCSQFYIGVGSPHFTLMTSLLRLPFIILISYGLILGKFGFPKLGLGGVMAATLIVQSVYCVGLLLCLYYSRRFIEYKLFDKFLIPKWTQIKVLFNVGYPIGVQYGGELLLMSILTYIMGFYGSAPLAASQIVSQYGLLIIMIMHGSGQGLSVLVSSADSQRNKQLVVDYLNAAFMISIILFIVTAITFSHSDFLLTLFIRDTSNITPELSYFMSYFFLISLFSLTIDGVRIYLTSALRGLKQTQYPMYVGILCLWLISLPVSCLMAFWLGFGPLGISTGFISGLFISSILLMKKFKQTILLKHPL
jgi:multidrug resistance protein, MATE family